jgi:hypothetical protein
MVYMVFPYRSSLCSDALYSAKHEDFVASTGYSQGCLNSCPLERFYFGAGEITLQIFTIKAPSWQLVLKQGKQTYCDQASSKLMSSVSGTEPSCMQYCHDIACI